MSKRFFGLFLALFAASALADVYSWVDDQGITHYGENVPAQYKKNARNLSGKKDTDRLSADQKYHEDFAEKQRQQRDNAQSRQAAREEIERKAYEFAVEMQARQKAKALTGGQ
jgi:phosphotransacetylase